jgi:hypothetical protein
MPFNSLTPETKRREAARIIGGFIIAKPYSEYAAPREI